MTEDRIGCEGCGMKIPDPGENPDPDSLLCDRCLRIQDGEEEDDDRETD